MEYRIFGPGGSEPSDGYREDIEELAKLNAAELASIAEWFTASTDFNPYASPLPANVAAGPLLPEKFRGAALAMRGLLYAWHEYGLERADVERDLLLLGVPSRALAAISEVLEQLSVLRKQVWLWYNVWESRQEACRRLMI